MNGADHLMRVFWPSDLPRDSRSSVLLGFRNSELDLFVVTVLDRIDPNYFTHDLVLRAPCFRSCPFPVSKLLDRCGNSALQIFGYLNPTDSLLKENRHWLFTATTSSTSVFPRITCRDKRVSTIQLIVFDRPDPTRLQYLSLTPILLALGDEFGAFNTNASHDGIVIEDEYEKARKADIARKLRLHSIVKPVPTCRESAFILAINQINCSYDLASLLHNNLSCTDAGNDRLSSSLVIATQFFCALVQLILRPVKPVLRFFLIAVIFVGRLISELLLTILEWRPYTSESALKDISAIAQQLDIRLQQFCYWPSQFLILRSRKYDWQSITTTHPEYIRFYNSLWLVANDIIIGIALGEYICENTNLIVTRLDLVFRQWTIARLERTIIWLMSSPAGLKLNTELANFLGDLTLWVIDFWAGLVSSTLPCLPGLIRLVGIASFAGATVPISLLSDLISIFTIHIHCFYVASTKIYHWQLSILSSLFHLFRGKKHNVLRNRIDSCDYDLDQLLLGTILFSILIFLLPTVMVFYATFACARMAIIITKALLEMSLACLNHFPLFAVMLRFKDSRRLPGGIRFELVSPTSSLASVFRFFSYATPSPSHFASSSSIAHIRLRSIPQPLTLTFHFYVYLFARLRTHYLTPSVAFCLITGRFVPPIPRKLLYSLQYSALPAQRIPLRQLWHDLQTFASSS